MVAGHDLGVARRRRAVAAPLAAVVRVHLPLRPRLRSRGAGGTVAHVALGFGLPLVAATSRGGLGGGVVDVDVDVAALFGVLRETLVVVVLVGELGDDVPGVD